jgi:hypothetical protein
MGVLRDVLKYYRDVLGVYKGVSGVYLGGTRGVLYKRVLGVF